MCHMLPDMSDVVCSREQLSDLRRQKERLEDKIMDFYKAREKQKKNKSLGAKLLQRMRGLKVGTQVCGRIRMQDLVLCRILALIPH